MRTAGVCGDVYIPRQAGIIAASAVEERAQPIGVHIVVVAGVTCSIIVVVTEGQFSYCRGASYTSEATAAGGRNSEGGWYGTGQKGIIRGLSAIVKRVVGV